MKKQNQEKLPLWQVMILAIGATDFRKQIPGLTALVQSKFKLDPYSTTCLFLFCNKRRTAMKALRYDSNGFLLASKSLLDDQRFLWFKSKSEVRDITATQFEWLLQGLELTRSTCSILWISLLKVRVFERIIPSQNALKTLDFPGKNVIFQHRFSALFSFIFDHFVVYYSYQKLR